MNRNDEIGSLIIERTGEVFSFSGNQFRATFPDGSTETFWSPPWHEWDKEEETKRAYTYAWKIWKERGPFKMREIL